MFEIGKEDHKVKNLIGFWESQTKQDEEMKSEIELGVNTKANFDNKRYLEVLKRERKRKAEELTNWMKRGGWEVEYYYYYYYCRDHHGIPG